MLVDKPTQLIQSTRKAELKPAARTKVCDFSDEPIWCHRAAGQQHVLTWKQEESAACDEV